MNIMDLSNEVLPLVMSIKSMWLKSMEHSITHPAISSQVPGTLMGG